MQTDQKTNGKKPDALSGARPLIMKTETDDLSLAQLSSVGETRRLVGQFLEKNWVTIPLPAGSKKPSGRGWEKTKWLEAVATLETDFPEGVARNVGVVLGEASAWLTDIDLDCDEAVELAPCFLTPTRTFGRASRPKSHWLYTCVGSKAHKFKEPNKGAMLLEIRSTGGQTVFPGSIHPSGEPIEFTSGTESEVTTAEFADLRRRVSLLAVATLLRRHFPPDAGARHDSLVAIAGGLLKAGVTDADATRILECVCPAMAEEAPQTIESTRARLSEGQPISTFNALVKAGVLTSGCVKALHDWLGSKSGMSTFAEGGGIIVDHRVDRMADQAIERLAKDDSIYQREGELVAVFQAESGIPDVVATGAPFIRSLKEDRLRDRLSAIGAAFVRPVKDDTFRAVAVPPEVLRIVVARGKYPGVRGIVGIIESPCVRPDGTILTREGYDPATGLWHEPSVVVPAVLDPNRDEAIAAWQRLVDLFSDFPFEHQDQVAVVIAALLTVLARPAIDGPTPAFAFDATTQGSGKTLLAKIVYKLATGRESGEIGFPYDAAEQEKVFGGLTRDGASLVVFDNLKDGSVFGGPTLDRLLTTTRNKFRVLGKSETVEMPWRAVIVLTGNNISPAKDTARRVLQVRLQPESEVPAERTGFKIGNILRHVGEHRASLLRDALTVLRGAAVGGAKGKSIGSYEAWALQINAAVQWVSGIDLTKHFAISTGDDPETAAAKVLFAAFETHFPNGATAKQISDLWSKNGIPPHGTALALTTAIEEVLAGDDRRDPTTRQIGTLLRGLRGRVLGGLVLSTSTSNKTLLTWKVRPRV